jgi:hypothetical protein
VLVVSGIAPVTTEWASYEYSIELQNKVELTR